jgi:pyridoxine 4-dehydrogenase
VNVVSVQNRYNVADRSSDAVLAACERDGIAFIPWSPLSQNPREAGHGARVRLASWASRRGVSLARASVAWLLSRSPAILPIPGTASIDHLQDNWAGATLRMTPEDLLAVG